MFRLLNLTLLGERFDQLKSMSTRIGGDVGAAVAGGRLRPAELRSAAMRCASCKSAESCAMWLSANAEPGEEQAPAFCTNRDLWQRLAAQTPN